MPTTHKPTFPVVDPEPSLDRAVANFNAADLLHISLFTTAGYATGFFGARKPFRVHNGRFLSGIGLLAGLTYAILSSSQRFMGLEKNDGEVKSYGALSPEQIAALLAKSNTTIPNIGLIDSSSKRN
jgi:hypothetical protein